MTLLKPKNSPLGAAVEGRAVVVGRGVGARPVAGQAVVQHYRGDEDPLGMRHVDEVVLVGVIDDVADLL